MEPGFWLWLILGFVLVGAEVMMPGAFLLWPGIAALLTGMVAYSMPGLGWQALAVLFAVLTVASALLGRRAYGHFRQPVEVALNRRAHMLVGSAHVLSTPILDGAGRLTLGGTTWTVNGPDLPAGAHVRIVGVDGAVLKVEKIEA